MAEAASFMECPGPEKLSRWSDRTLKPSEAAEVGRHIEACPDCGRIARALRDACAWVESVGEPGPYCLSPDEAAEALAGGPVPPHALTCPRCAAELADLRPARRRRRAVLRARREEPRVFWFAAAAAAAVAAGVLFALASRPRQEPYREVARGAEDLWEIPETIPGPVPGGEVQAETPVAAPPAPPVLEAEPPRMEAPTARIPPPGPADVKPAPETPVPSREPPATVAEPRRPAEALFEVKAGGLLGNLSGKWQRVSRVEEGVTLKADGRTLMEFARAQILLDGGAQFSLAGGEMTFLVGGVSAQVVPRSEFVLNLGQCRIVPQVASARALIRAAGNRVVVDEGWARFGEALLLEGVEHEARGGRLEPQKVRTLSAAARPREALAWRLDLANKNATRGKLVRGRVVSTPWGPALASTEAADPPPSPYGGIHYFAGGDSVTLVVKPTTCFRFRYLLKRPAPLEFVMRNVTKDESFGVSIPGPVGAWTTATIRVMDIPVKPGGFKVTCEPGDRYGWFAWHVGRAGVPGEVMVNRIEVVEIER